MESLGHSRLCRLGPQSAKARPRLLAAGRRGRRTAQAARTEPEAPLVGEITRSKIKNMKELRPGSTGRSEIRILFVFDPWQQIVLLVAGDKAGNWRGWYRKAIPRAEQLYAEHIEAMSRSETGDR